ncbi:MAG: amidohydrolase family protein [Desulfovibrionaceae bacterium]|nr:amidohydrolase family protein [Desulfovibrionaceae bacterium]
MVLSRRRFLASLAGLAALSLPGAALAAPPGKYALAGRVLSGADLRPLDNHAVLVENGLIEAVVPAASVADRPVIGVPGCTVLPGIINAHCHRIHTPEDRRKRWLEHGVTAVGDPGSPLDAMADLARSPAGTTATAAFSGPMLAVPGGYPLPVHDPKYGLVVRSPREAGDAVRRLADRGATMIKLAFEPGVMPRPWPMPDPATARDACDTARRIGLTVRCHVQDLAGLEPALDAGVHTVEHVPHRRFVEGRPRPVLDRDNAVMPAYARLLERMARDAVILTPTLDVLSRSLWNGPALYEPVRAFAAMGGRLAVGNDYPYLRTEAGMVLRELELLGRAGLSGRDALRAATVGSAAACGFTDRGIIARGMRADLLVTDNDPAADPGALAAPLHIVKDGVFVA